MIFPVSGAGVSRPQLAPQRVPAPTQQLKESPPGDRVELSEVAVIVARLRGTPPERMAKILSIKRELDQGNYLTQEKLADALRNLIDTLSHRALRRT